MVGVDPTFAAPNADLAGEECLAWTTGTSSDWVEGGEEDLDLLSASVVSFSKHNESFNSRFLRAAAFMEI